MNKYIFLKSLLIFVFLFVTGSFLFVSDTHAARFTQAAFRPNRVGATAGSVPVLVVAKVSVAGDVEAKFRITVPASSLVVGSAPAILVSTASITGMTYEGNTLTAWTGIGQSATTSTSTTIVFDSANLSSASLYYAFFITAGLTNPSAGVTVLTLETLTSGDVSLESSSVALRIISNDLISVTASVDPAFTLVLSGNTAAFPTSLTTSSVGSAPGPTATITTNAGQGWTAWISSANAGLTSATAAHTIQISGGCTIDDTPKTVSPGTESYVIDVDKTTDSATSGTGVVTIDSEYNGSVLQGGCPSTTLQQVAYANGPTDGDVLTILPRAGISAITQAANDYADTLTFVASGDF